MKIINLNKKMKLLVIILFTAVFIVTASSAEAASNVAKVSFTFDDGFVSTLTSAAPVLDKYGLDGTIYVATGCIKNIGPCRNNVNPVASYMTWAQVKQLQNTYGWEIGGHTVNHKRLSELTPAQRETEILQGKRDLQNKGLNVSQFASPEGDYDYATLAQVSKYYASHRGFWDRNRNGFPYNDSILHVKQVQEPVSVAEVKTAVDQAIANKEWLILVFHRIKSQANPDPDEYEYSKSKLDQIASYVKTKQNAGQIRSVKVSEGLAITETNIFPNHSFDNGISGGWTTDNSAAVIKDTSSKGVFPSSASSIQFTGAGTGHLFAPLVPVVSNSRYAFKAFINTLGRTGGEFGFYIDEYNASGTWISGQYYPVYNLVVSYFNLNYTPSSPSVAKFRIQTFFAGNPSGKVYVDNYQLYNMTSNQGVTSGEGFSEPISASALRSAEEPSVRPSLTLTPTPTAQISAMPTITATPSPVLSPSLTVTPSVSSTITPTPSVVMTVTPKPISHLP